MPAMLLQLHLSKAFDKLSWLYLMLMLIHIELTLQVVNWIMCFLTSVSFAILINESTSIYFNSLKGTKEGFVCHLFYSY
jgi:hypothetical protein